MGVGGATGMGMCAALEMGSAVAIDGPMAINNLW